MRACPDRRILLARTNPHALCINGASASSGGKHKMNVVGGLRYLSPLSMRKHPDCASTYFRGRVGPPANVVIPSVNDD